MPTKDTSQLKENILLVFKTRGPGLPVHIASELKISILFASAFLSELVSEKKIKISNMRVGNSPLYFIPGQEPLLEKFSQYLKSKEKDAFFLLKEKKFLIDSKQDPAIRVALRVIKDFAKPFKKKDEIIWRYLTIPESEFEIDKPLIKEDIKDIKPIDDVKITKSVESIKGIKVSRGDSGASDFAKNRKELGEQSQELDGGQNQEKSLGIFDEKPIKKIIIRRPIKRTKTVSQKKNEKFFNKVKEFLSDKPIEILDIVSFSKSDLVLKIKDNETEKLLVAYNKKRITETDIMNAYKKSLEVNLPYILLSLAEPSKKLSNLINAIKRLAGIDKIE